MTTLAGPLSPMGRRCMLQQSIRAVSLALCTSCKHQSLGKLRNTETRDMEWKRHDWLALHEISIRGRRKYRKYETHAHRKKEEEEYILTFQKREIRLVYQIVYDRITDSIEGEISIGFVWFTLTHVLLVSSTGSTTSTNRKQLLHFHSKLRIITKIAFRTKLSYFVFVVEGYIGVKG